MFAKPDALKGSLSETIALHRPHVLIGVPRVYEKMQASIEKILMQQNGLARWAISKCLDKVLLANECAMQVGATHINQRYWPATFSNKTGTSQVGAQNSKRTSKCQTIGELGTLLWKKMENKSRNAEKKLKGDPLVSSGVVFTRETFLVQFFGPTGTIWRLLKILGFFLSPPPTPKILEVNFLKNFILA